MGGRLRERSKTLDTMLKTVEERHKVQEVTQSSAKGDEVEESKAGSAGDNDDDALRALLLQNQLVFECADYKECMEKLVEDESNRKKFTLIHVDPPYGVLTADLEERSRDQIPSQLETVVLENASVLLEDGGTLLIWCGNMNRCAEWHRRVGMYDRLYHESNSPITVRFLILVHA